MYKIAFAYNIRWFYNYNKKWREVQIKNDDKDYVISRFGEPLCKSTISRIIKRHAIFQEIKKEIGRISPLYLYLSDCEEVLSIR